MMFNFIVFVVSTYLAITIGLYFKALTFKSEVKYKKKAFVAPLYWIALIFVMLSHNDSRKNLLAFVILHPYVSLLSCFVAIANMPDTKAKRSTYNDIVGAYEKDLALCGFSL